MIDPTFISEVSRHVWQSKYRFLDNPAGPEQRIKDIWRRIARAVGAVEPESQADWEARFLDVLKDFKFLPGGRIQAGAGTRRNVTLLRRQSE